MTPPCSDTPYGHRLVEAAVEVGDWPHLRFPLPDSLGQLGPAQPT